MIESVGNKPWYLGGDVDTLQVKSAVSGVLGMTSLSLTSFNSLSDMISLLLDITNPSVVNNPHSIRQKALTFYRITRENKAAIHTKLEHASSKQINQLFDMLESKMVATI